MFSYLQIKGGYMRDEWNNKKVYNELKKYLPDAYVRAGYYDGFDVVSIESPLGCLKRTIPFNIYDRFLKGKLDYVSHNLNEIVKKAGDKFIEYGKSKNIKFDDFYKVRAKCEVR